MATDAPKRLKECLSSMPDRVLTVGTGGSFGAALFAAKAINAFEQSIAVAVKPRDALLCRAEKYDLVILFSYSGRTPDIAEVVRTCAARFAFEVLTGSFPVCYNGDMPLCGKSPSERSDEQRR